MHPEIEKLIAIAKDNGKLTERQKEIILRKAESLGEDKDEVEFLLETISQDVSLNSATASNNVTDFAVALSEQTGKEKVNKCPHCGAPVTDTMLSCPECGYTLQRENLASIEARISIDKLRDQLLTCNAGIKQEVLSRYMGIDLSVKKKISLINTFTMPATKEGLMQFLEFAYSNYISAPDSGLDFLQNSGSLKDAWYGKTMQAYNMLSRLGSKDQEIQQYLQQYSALIKKEKKKLSKKSKLILGYVLFCVINCAWIIPLAYFGIKGDNAALEQVEMCIQNHDYQGAKAAANKYSGDNKKLIDDISSQEVVYLLSQGETLQAKAVAASINDENKRESIMQSIAETEKMENQNTGLEKNEIIENAEMQNTNAVFKEIIE